MFGVVHEDNELLVLNKASGVSVLADRSGRPCLLDELKRRYAHPRLVHRIDKGTSGLLLVALTAPVQRALTQAFAKRAVRKHYLAIVDGVMPTGATLRIDLPLRRGRKSRYRIAGLRDEIVSTARGWHLPSQAREGGINAITRVRPLLKLPVEDAQPVEVDAPSMPGVTQSGVPVVDAVARTTAWRLEWTRSGRPADNPKAPRGRLTAPAARQQLIAIQPLTGRTHQIRVHLAWIGHPIAGDHLYGPKRPSPMPDGRMALHAHRLVIPGFGTFHAGPSLEPRMRKPTANGRVFAKQPSSARQSESTLAEDSPNLSNAK